MGGFTFPCDGYVINDNPSVVGGYLQGSNKLSALWLSPYCRIFVKKGMYANISEANTIYWLPFT